MEPIGTGSRIDKQYRTMNPRNRSMTKKSAWVRKSFTRRFAARGQNACGPAVAVVSESARWLSFSNFCSTGIEHVAYRRTKIAVWASKMAPWDCDVVCNGKVCVASNVSFKSSQPSRFQSPRTPPILRDSSDLESVDPKLFKLTVGYSTLTLCCCAIFFTALASASQFHHRCSRSAFILWRFSDRGDMRMLAQVLAQSFAQDAHAAAVHNTHARQAGEEGAVHEFLYSPRGFVHVFADDIDFRSGRVVFLRNLDRDAFPIAGGL